MAEAIILGPMNVLDSCGMRVGVADRVEGHWLRMADDGGPRHRYLPLHSVGRIDRFIHLTLSLEDVRRRWVEGVAPAWAA